ncbi:16S rRNA (uracil(1498)-N(3))-methyltransferase [Caldimonas tepidiphila]|uniref:16S rRNA (uracil(1498)-N(3))-methyltransferase n=1 Tax=Caldimonas tepidiphila TaxID=2315841 RepID=UPI000E5A61CA|nr:16S rRNA (uracil(1498)-N(3))-methyltransferase [Caldimonas tepidiphila]
MPRIHAELPLAEGATVLLPPAAARHVQVLRLQPGEALTLFNGEGGEWAASVTRMGRSDVEVRVGLHAPLDRESAQAVTLALGMPANERMDWLVEKATELGVAAIQPLMTERSVLRLSGERADKKVAHWRAVAVAAAEQCGRTRVPAIGPVRSLADWLRQPPPEAGLDLVLSLREARPLAERVAPARRAGRLPPLRLLSGPEGGLSAAEEDAARAAGFAPVSLGARVLRAETAPLAVLAWLELDAPAAG